MGFISGTWVPCTPRLLKMYPHGCAEMPRRSAVTHSHDHFVAKPLALPEEDLWRALTERQLSVFMLIAVGTPLKAIARELHMGVSTVSTHRERILLEMGYDNNAQLTAYAIEYELIDISTLLKRNLP